VPDVARLLYNLPQALGFVLDRWSSSARSLHPIPETAFLTSRRRRPAYSVRSVYESEPATPSRGRLVTSAHNCGDHLERRDCCEKMRQCSTNCCTTSCAPRASRATSKVGDLDVGPIVPVRYDPGIAAADAALAKGHESGGRDK
jgi:hypothetical protein